ncbi:hypothetical protein K2173_023281 [Erythroxylum novogranatense]|uniref:Protein GAMETE EXPRESSED 1 n=1 Tax=Erythroxylum novogranatense TaxID=1862640 RepID=A0AAV8T8E0_9ROSI|nr:hypothetical protein K2173_023281 [Erythroxylum novogranatense]
MSHYTRHHIVLLVIFISVFPSCRSWGWFSSSSSSSSQARKEPSSYTKDFSVAEFSMDGFRDDKGIKLVENARNKLAHSNSCWQNAYQQLFSGCSQILDVEEKRSRFAWHLSDCFQKDSGRPPFPYCDKESAMVHCLRQLSENENKVYLEFLLETNSICHQLQANAFKNKMERLVNDLKSSAEFAEGRLESIQEKADSLLQSSNEIHDSLDSVDTRVRNVAKTAGGLSDQMNVLSKHSEAVFEQSKEIADSQLKLLEEQGRMNENFKEGMAIIQDGYNNLDQQVNNLMNEATEIEKQMGNLEVTMSSTMQNIRTKAENIENVAEKSLDKQQELLDGQSTALKGLQLLTESQSEALEESRTTLQRLAEYGRRQQEELLQRQQHLQQVHDHLIQNSNSILAAQEAFESKQASMFVVLEKLFALHNTMLLESRIVKAFFIYCMLIFIIHMFTSTKQTYEARARLHIGLCVAFSVEVAVLRLTATSIDQQTWMINTIRLLFVLLASFQLLYAIYTYRDYEALNHKMILTLMEKVNAMQSDHKQLSWETGYQINWPYWLKTELPEDDTLEDPDYTSDEVEENSITTNSMIDTYNLRSRSRG